MNFTFADLTLYSHLIQPFALKNVFNVGWLDPREPLETGDVPETVKRKLRQLVLDKSSRCMVERARDWPTCPVCGPVLPAPGQPSLVDGEFWVPSGDVVYASPVLLLHLIDAHRYLPPSAYLDAVEAFSPSDTFDGVVVFHQKLKECGWFDATFSAGDGAV